VESSAGHERRTLQRNASFRIGTITDTMLSH
jgi:hypothetical protein